MVKPSDRVGVPKLAPHDLRTCARLCHASGAESGQTQFLGTRFGSNDGALSRLQAMDSVGGR